MAERNCAAGAERFLRSKPARELQQQSCNDPGIAPGSRRDALVILAAAGRDRQGLRFDILLAAGGCETPLVISAPEASAIAEWQRCARAHKAGLALYDDDGAVQRISAAQAAPSPRRLGSPLRTRRPRFLTRRRTGAAKPARKRAEGSAVTQG